MKIYKIAAIATIALSITACSDFVDIKTQGGIVPDKIDNFRYLLNNTNEWVKGSALPDIMSDDIYIKDGGLQYNSAVNGGDFYAWFAKTYTWSDQIYPESGNYNKDDGWNAMYNTSAYANTVINEIGKCTDGTPEQKAALVAEAKVHRADAYLMLVNQYARQYDEATAATDPGVPLILTQSTEQDIKRASVKAVYEQIIKDLTDAIPALPEFQEFTTMPTKASAYGELARAYLLMGRYKDAFDNAELALAQNGNIVDLNEGDYPQLIKCPEILLLKQPTQTNSMYGCTLLHLSDGITDLLGEKDLRYQKWTAAIETAASNFAADGGRVFYQDIPLGGRNIGPSVPEMILIKAEYYARENQPLEAMKCVNDLRKKRFAPADYQELSAADGDEALEIVIDERHREFFCKNLRWYDLRRLASDSRFVKTLTRQWGGKTLTLEPNGNRYVLPIPQYQIILAPGIVQNP